MQRCRLFGLRPPFAAYRKCVCLFLVLFVFSLDNKEKPHIYINAECARLVRRNGQRSYKTVPRTHGSEMCLGCQNRIGAMSSALVSESSVNIRDMSQLARTVDELTS